ncbi:MAG TPA: glycosyltransferase family 4 protein [Steroidobacteraceae bacterium]|nr:glycosyltransferase family 4 protein [Steroidobacteraceae bacterium]
MSADPTTVLLPRVVPPRAPAPREARVKVLQMGPALDVRGGISSVEQLICDYLPPYASIRHVATMTEGAKLTNAVVFARAIFTLARTLDGIDPAIVHIHFASRGSTLRKMILANMVLRARRPLILHAHGAGFDQFHRGLPAPVRSFVSRTLQQASVLIALSSQWRDFYVHECEVSPSQVVVLPNPVRVPARVTDRSGRAEVQFLHLGRLGRRKGGYDLMNAFAALPESLRARARLVLAGDGDVEGMRKLAAPFGDRVRVLSWIDANERDRLLAESDVFVLPSYAEGVPMSLLEAMAAGLPSITTPVGGIPDVFKHGAEGMLVAPGDAAQLRTAMSTYIGDEAARLAAGRRAYESARAFDVHAYARRLADIYQRIAPVAELRETA